MSTNHDPVRLQSSMQAESQLQLPLTLDSSGDQDQDSNSSRVSEEETATALKNCNQILGQEYQWLKSWFGGK